jgi:hypothetical protein
VCFTLLLPVQRKPLEKSGLQAVKNTPSLKLDQSVAVHKFANRVHHNLATHVPDYWQDKPVALATHVVVVNIKTKQVNNLVKNATQDNTKIRLGGYLVKNVWVVIQVILVRQNVTVLIHQVFVHLGLIASGK